MIELQTRTLTFQSGPLTLEGALHLPATTPAGAIAVCHPHPQYGGDMENNVVLAACGALAGAGFAALRFNFRGAGRSEGAFEGGAGERDDVRAALAELAHQPEVDAARIGLAGYSFGALMASEAAGPGVSALALISPPVAAADLRVDWSCPVLVIAGDRDEFAPAERLSVLAGRSGVELRSIAGADHFWWGYEDRLGEALVEFFHAHL